MNIQGWVVWSTLAFSTGAVRRAGWLDRVVLHYKNKFIEEFKQLAPINIEASIEKAPSGYVDSPDWDFESVTRLLALIRESETARPVQASLRRMLAPTRRFMSKQKSYKFFPSLAQKHFNNFYYDDETGEDYNESDGGIVGGVPPDTAVVQVRNPVEARLPSARISVKLLRDILEARAIAARKMPPKKTTRSPWTWMKPNATTILQPITTETPVISTNAPNSTDSVAEKTTVSAPEEKPATDAGKKEETTEKKDEEPATTEKAEE